MRRTTAIAEWCLAPLLLLAAARLAVPAAASDFQVSVMQLPNGETATIIEHRGTKYQKVNPGQLSGLTYVNQRVCFEIKYDAREEGRKVFQALGFADLRIVYEKRNLRNFVNSLIPSDNVWVGGWARRKRRERRCYLLLVAAVKLKDDRALFQERFDRYRRVGDWRQLVELGKEIVRSARLDPRLSLGSFDEFKRYRKQAFRTALDIRRRQLADNDANGHYDVAHMYIEMLDDPLTARILLRRCLEINPQHRRAIAQLRDFGFVEYEGKWVTPGERDRRLREKGEADARARTAADAAERVRQERLRIEREAAELRARKFARSLQRRIAARGRAEAAMIREAMTVDNEALGRYLVRVLAADGSAGSLDGLTELMRSKHPEVRRDLADALAFKGDAEARHFLNKIIRGDEDEQVRRHAVAALAWIGDADAMGFLIALLSARAPGVGGLAAAALTDLTGKDLGTDAAAWRDWWEVSQKTFEPSPRK